MHLKSIIKRSACCLLMAASAVTAFGQDLIANQAPIDRKLKAVDSVSLQRYILTRYDNNAVDQLYSSWNTNKAHCYVASEVPDSFRIDLRGFAMPTPSRLVTSRFGYRPAFRRQHKGLDIKVYTGDTIVSAFDGKVRCANYDAGGYGYYIVATKQIGNKTIYGITGANAIMHGDWTEGDMDCSINIDTAKPTQWIIARGKIHRYGKTIDAPQYWYCDANGVRFPGRKASFGWNGAYAYQDPSF